MLRRHMIRENSEKDYAERDWKMARGRKGGMSEEMEENHEAPSMSSADGLICKIAVDPNGVSRDWLSIYSILLIHISFFVMCSGVSVWETSYPSIEVR